VSKEMARLDQGFLIRERNGSGPNTSTGYDVA
jgi:hypothetical protein